MTAPIYNINGLYLMDIRSCAWAQSESDSGVAASIIDNVSRSVAI